MSAVLGIISLVSKLGSKFIVDKDKRTEFAFKTQELAFKTMDTLLQSKTYPWIDGAVKLMYAFQVFWRPAITTVMTMFGAYAHWKGIDLGNSHVIFDGAFPAWGVSRHINKQKKKTEWDEED